MQYETLNILVVDDDNGDRKQITRALRQAGLTSTCAEALNVSDALAACERSAFDLAIVDYHLPGDNGLEGITALLESLPYLAIIMSTGQGDEMIASQAIKRGALDYIQKSSIDPQSIRHLAERALAKVALMRKIAEQRDELENFAQLLVHDLKTPLRSICLMTGLIERSIDGEDPREIVEMCRTVGKAAQRMGALIDTVRQYTQAKHQVVFEPIAMQQVIRDTLFSLEHLIQERDASVTHGDLPVISGNAPQLIQLLQNLIGNSIKYCDDKTPSVHVAASTPEEGTWVFTVKDNGIGIPERYLRQIFEPFKRVCTPNKYEGTGLGLATCKKIVERHNGRIWCESSEGEGSTIFFTLQGLWCKLRDRL